MTSVRMSFERTAEKVVASTEQPTESDLEASNSTDTITYSTIGNNLDTNITPHYKRTGESSNQSVHCFKYFAVKGKILEFSQLSIQPYHTCSYMLRYLH